MKRTLDPYDGTLAEIRRLLVVPSGRISDDSDQWFAIHMGYSLMEERGKGIMGDLERGRALILELLQVGEPAAPAVAKALRTQGRWREDLLPFARQFRRTPCIQEALTLVSRRQIDPLAALDDRQEGLEGIPTRRTDDVTDD